MEERNWLRGLYWVFSKIWDEKKLPEEWMDGVVCPIYTAKKLHVGVKCFYT